MTEPYLLALAETGPVGAFFTMWDLSKSGPLDLVLDGSFGPWP